MLASYWTLVEHLGMTTETSFTVNHKIVLKTCFPLFIMLIKYWVPQHHQHHHHCHHHRHHHHHHHHYRLHNHHRHHHHLIMHSTLSRSKLVPISPLSTSFVVICFIILNIFFFFIITFPLHYHSFSTINSFPGGFHQNLHCANFHISASTTVTQVPHQPKWN